MADHSIELESNGSTDFRPQNTSNLDDCDQSPIVSSCQNPVSHNQFLSDTPKTQNCSSKIRNNSKGRHQILSENEGTYDDMHMVNDLETTDGPTPKVIIDINRNVNNHSRISEKPYSKSMFNPIPIKTQRLTLNVNHGDFIYRQVHDSNFGVQRTYNDCKTANDHMRASTGSNKMKSYSMNNSLSRDSKAKQIAKFTRNTITPKDRNLYDSKIYANEKAKTINVSDYAKRIRSRTSIDGCQKIEKVPQYQYRVVKQPQRIKTFELPKSINRKITNSKIRPKTMIDHQRWFRAQTKCAIRQAYDSKVESTIKSKLRDEHKSPETENVNINDVKLNKKFLASYKLNPTSPLSGTQNWMRFVPQKVIKSERKELSSKVKIYDRNYLKQIKEDEGNSGLRLESHSIKPMITANKSYIMAMKESESRIVMTNRCISSLINSPKNMDGKKSKGLYKLPVYEQMQSHFSTAAPSMISTTPMNMKDNSKYIKKLGFNTPVLQTLQSETSHFKKNKNSVRLISQLSKLKGRKFSKNSDLSHKRGSKHIQNPPISVGNSRFGNISARGKERPPINDDIRDVF